ncbi:hypothetical protein PTTG_29418 [Puccinia triticina 1-1 BBBD Race 1]|uniref:tRNA-synt_1c domain-containing protein n=2 Tax=Puccinia triticina TaxID=208348 RepID=A0A180G468_PUCT1|nr:hypothetical protein PTTG_29418 [Puccinia triticina 1-1 BBBD Race 1]
MGISHVLRGEEWLSSTPKHILLYNAFDFPLPKFAHLPLLVNADGSKLSKRSGDVRVEDYISKGYEPEALLNFVALMGMNHSRHGADEGKTGDKTTDVMTMEQMVSAFSIEVIGKHRSTMSQPKLVHLNQQHIARSLLSTDPAQVQPWIARARSILPCGAGKPEVSDAYVHRVLLAMKDRLHVFTDIKYLAEYFFTLPDLSSSEAREMRKNISDALYRRILESSRAILSELPDDETGYTRAKVAQGLKQVQDTDPETSSKQVMVALRHAITGRKIGPGMAETIEVLGKRRTLERIEAALQ